MQDEYDGKTGNGPGKGQEFIRLKARCLSMARSLAGDSGGGQGAVSANSADDGDIPIDLANSLNAIKDWADQ
jgi:hypothetical protein